MRKKPDPASDLLKRHERIQKEYKIARSDDQHAKNAVNNCQGRLDQQVLRHREAEKFIPIIKSELDGLIPDARSKDEKFKIKNKEFNEVETELKKYLADLEQWKREKKEEDKKLNELRALGN